MYVCTHVRAGWQHVGDGHQDLCGILILLSNIYKAFPDAFVTNALYESVLGLAEMEFIFPVAALIVLCSVLVARKVLVTQQRFGYC